MISAISGELRAIEGGRIELAVGPMVCEVMVPASDGPTLAGRVGQTLTLFTIFYLEGDAARGNLEPRLLGFLRADDKRFFERFITVKGIGPKRALRALARPVGEIARAIEARDTRFLVGLPEIGKRTAEQIVAELAGKVGPFALGGTGSEMGADGAPLAPTGRWSAAEEDAIAALMALGEKRGDAEGWLDRAKRSNPEATTTDRLLREMLRLRTGRG